MNRYLPILLLSLWAWAPTTLYANDRTTSDPNHIGYVTGQFDTPYEVKWTPRESHCQPCKELFSTYNRIMTALLDARYRLARLRHRVKMQERGMEQAKERQESGQSLSPLTDSTPGLSNVGENLASGRMLDLMAADTIRSKLIPETEQVISHLEGIERELRPQLERCEQQCTDDKGGKDAISVGPASTGTLLPFKWGGPYPEACHRCAKLAARLNELPKLAYQTLGMLNAAKAERALLEMLNEELGYSHPTSTHEAEVRRKNHAEREAQIAQLDKEIARHDANLDKIKENFNQTLKLYNDCLPTCKKKKVACVVPNEKAIRVGPNDQYGSGAQLQEKVGGMASGLLGGLMGGSGISFGGGGPDSGSTASGPDTVDDPTAGDFRRFLPAHPGAEHKGGVKAGGRLTLVDGKLTASIKLDDVPGDGTFHSIWLQDANGKIVLPIGYLVISLYQDWQLTVSWTHDRWVNNEHVLHEEGKEVSFGTEHLGSYRHKLEGEKGVKNSIWYNHGFSTATKGIDHIAAIFPITKSALDGPCPMQLVTHITLPDQDPVVTVPLILEVKDVTEAKSKPKQGSSSDNGFSWPSY